MRRKSTRNTAKASPEKVVEPTSTRRSRRHSKRRKRSSSRSSSEGSDDVNLKAVAQQLAEVPPEDIPKISLPGEEDPEQTHWKVKQTGAPSGEIQKLKICITRPAPPSPDKVEQPTGRRLRSKSGSQAEEDVTSQDVTSPDEKNPRKTKHRNSPGVNIEEIEEQVEESEDKKGKGKSKTKHKSKSEKTPKIQDLQDETQCEIQISENVQVTSQSPQADIRVDNDSVPPNEHESIDTNVTDTNITEEKEDDPVIREPTTDDASTDISNEKTGDFKGFDATNQSMEIQEVGEEVESAKTEEPIVESPPEVEEEVVVAQETDEVQIIIPPSDQPELVVQNNEVVEEKEDTQMEEVNQEETTSPVRSESVEKTEVVVEEMQISEEKEQDSNISEQNVIEVTAEPMQTEEVPVRRESKAESSSSEEPEIVEQKDAAEPEKSPVHNKDESNTISIPIAESQQSDDDSRSADIMTIESSSTPQKEESSFNLTQSFSPDIREIVETNNELQTMKDQISDLFPTPNPIKRRRKWGTSLVGLELLAPTLNKIDINSIKELCPDLKLLEESELRMEIREARDRRKSTTELREKKSERKVSIEHQSNEDKRLETQDSVNSTEMEEVNEPEVDNSNIIAMNRKISIVDDTASKLKPPPSPAKNPISEVLYITNLVRPFTLKQLKELLERTGKIKENGFWTDRIKSKCYVYYETIEEAEATRNALHGVHWPIGNGKKLFIDYATSEDLEKARNPAPAAPPVIPEEKVPEKENQVPPKKNKIEEPEKVIKERERHRSETHVREWDIGKVDLNKGRSRSREHENRNDRNDRRKHRRTPSPVEDFMSRKQRKKEEDVPQKLMDDLFRKTKTTPSIYWLPLTPEEIATKQQQRLLRMAEHKRRMEESSRGRGGDYGRGAPPYRRRYD